MGREPSAQRKRRQSHSSLDEGVFAGGVKVRVKIAKKMTSARKVFGGGSDAKRSISNVASYC